MTDQPQHLFLIRHGQTALNAEGRLRGLANPPLDEVGRSEAEETAIALTGRGIDIVYCSPIAVLTSTVVDSVDGCFASDAEVGSV
nr:histidine phosphatase family protein [Leifsonia aquatica]